MVDTNAVVVPHGFSNETFQAIIVFLNETTHRFSLDFISWNVLFDLAIYLQSTYLINKKLDSLLFDAELKLKEVVHVLVSLLRYFPWNESCVQRVVSCLVCRTSLSEKEIFHILDFEEGTDKHPKCVKFQKLYWKVRDSNRKMAHFWNVCDQYAAKRRGESYYKFSKRYDVLNKQKLCPLCSHVIDSHSCFKGAKATVTFTRCCYTIVHIPCYEEFLQLSVGAAPELVVCGACDSFYHEGAAQISETPSFNQVTRHKILASRGIPVNAAYPSVFPSPGNAEIFSIGHHNVEMYFPRKHKNHPLWYKTTAE